MNDPFGRGLIASLIGLLFINIIELFMKFIKLSETALWQAGGYVFITDEKVLNTPLGIAVGFSSHVFIGIFAGISISYFLYSTGNKNGVLKGITVALSFLYLAQGIVFPLKNLAVGIENTPKDVISAYIDHFVFGAVTAYVIIYLQKMTTKKSSG